MVVGFPNGEVIRSPWVVKETSWCLELNEHFPLDQAEIELHENGDKIYRWKDGRNCGRGLPLGQSFASSGSARCSLHDEDHSGTRLHSFPGLCHVRSGTPLEWL